MCSVPRQVAAFRNGTAIAATAPACATGRSTRSARTQSSIAVSADGVSWVLINASPDILSSGGAVPAAPAGARARHRHRRRGADRQPDRPHDGPAHAARGRAARRLLHGHGAPGPHHRQSVVPHPRPLLRRRTGTACETGPAARSPSPGVAGLAFGALPLTSKAPPYSPHRDAPAPGDNIGLVIEDATIRRQGVLRAGPRRNRARTWRRRWQPADCLLVDGTFWSDDEMLRLGVSNKRARDIGHLAQSGTDGMIARACRASASRARSSSTSTTPIPSWTRIRPSARSLRSSGIEVAYDGMEITI